MIATNGVRGGRWTVVVLLVSLLMPFVAQSGSAQSSAGKTIVYPGAVTIQAGTCVDGEPTPATVSVPSDTAADGIFYTITQPNASGSFEIHAQVGDAYHFGDTSGTGWNRTNVWNAYYTGVAPQDDCTGNGPSVQQDSVPDTNNPGIGVFALPQDCGSAPYPAPTGTNVTAGVAFSNYIITQNGIAHAGGPLSLTSSNEVLTLSFDWLATEPIAAGQFFFFEGPLDTNGDKVFTSATQWFPVMNTAGTAQAGCASVVGGDITVQFTSYVDGRSGVDGTINLFVEMANGASDEATTIDFSFDDDSTFSITIPGIPTDSFGKRGWFMRDDQGIVEPGTSIRWTIHVPAATSGYTNLVLADNAPDDGSWSFSCAGPGATSTTYVAVGPQGPVTDLGITEDCTATQMILTVPAVPRNTAIDFYFYADITPFAEGPFYNIATAQADEINRVELPYEVRRTIGSGIADGSFAVMPVPPAIDHAVCVDDSNQVWQPAAVTLPQQQAGVTYAMSPDPFPAEGGHLVVTASLHEGYVWASGADSNGWVLDQATNTMVYEADVLNDPCLPTVTETPTETPIVTPSPTPEQPCIPPTPETCLPTPPAGGGTPVPCEPTPPATVPAWCSETPTPPTVTHLPNTGDEGSNAAGSSVLVGGVMVVIAAAMAGFATRRGRA